MEDFDLEKTLKEFAPGECGTVTAISVEGDVRRRLFDMGVTPGACLCMRKTAPLGDPIQVCVRGYELSIRKKEAAGIMLKPFGGGRAS